jgi:uncharacterized protein with NRDE domain
MCILAVALRAHPSAPLIVAANRDEALDRPATPPRRWGGFVAGRDEVGGGTWLGFTDNGLFVGLTNLWWSDHRRRRPRSRGEVVTTLLSADTLAGAERALRSLSISEYGRFNVICATRDGRGFAAGASDRLHLMPLSAGVFVVSNLLPGEPWSKTEQVHADVTDAIGAPIDRLPAALAGRLSRVTDGGSPQQSACVITEHNYGTVSSTILLAGGASEVLRFADGRPDRTPFHDYSALLAQRT